jgi:RNA polymerase sigma-70 factor (ECF subfamily)
MSGIQTLYEQHASKVFRFAYGLCGDTHLANDLVAETFVRAMLSSAPIVTETVHAYLFTIARRLYLKEWHRHQRHSELEDVHCDTAPGPEEQAIDAQSFQNTLDALQQLPEIDRAALLMRAEDAVPYEDIARALEISLSSAKVKVFRARLKLSQLLKDES